MSEIFEKPEDASITSSKEESEAFKESRVFAASGDRLVEQGSYNTAIVMYDEALQLIPDDTTILLSRSLAYLLSEPPAIDLAQKDVERCLDVEPENWQAWQLKGDLLIRNNNFHEAEPAFLKAITYSKGMDKVRAQRSLADGRSKANVAVPLPISNTSLHRNASIARRPLPAYEPPTAELTQLTVELDQPSTSLASEVETLTVEPEEMTIRPEDLEPAPSQRLTRRGSRMARQPTVIRSDTESSARSEPAQSLPMRTVEIMELTNTDNIPDEAPPDYSPRVNSQTLDQMSPDELVNRMEALAEGLASKTQGGLALKAFTGPDGIDSVVVLLAGLPPEQMLGAEPFVPVINPAFEAMTVDCIRFPGNTFEDIDAEAFAFYSAKVPGTVLIAGYSQEYREHQLLRQPHVNIFKEGQISLPKVPLKNIMKRLQEIQLAPAGTDLENDSELATKFLGLSALEILRTGFHIGGSRQSKIESICLMFTHTAYEDPTRFVDIPQIPSIAFHFLEQEDQNEQVRDFFYQMLIGIELVVRLRKEPTTTSWHGIVSDHLSNVMAMAAQLIQGVLILSPNADESKYSFFPVKHQKQTEALIQFAETLSWPCLDEARGKIENAFTDLVQNSQSTYAICDWLFGVTKPGKLFRHGLMACLVQSSPSISEVGSASFYNDGLVVKGKSYWPQRNVLGRVFGALQSSKMVCGWVGPVQAPEGDLSGWFTLTARRLDIPAPASPDGSSAAVTDIISSYFSNTQEMAFSLTNLDDYIQSTPPPKPAGSQTVVFKSYKLDQVPAGTNVKEYRATLYFEIDGKEVSYALFTNPIFVNATPCIGDNHAMHKAQQLAFHKNTIRVAELGETLLEKGTLLTIYAIGDQEELLARAWCAERGRHAVVRRDGSAQNCCYSCAAGIACSVSGLGFDVLIWSCVA
ncbi:hypothetical protein G7Y89_g14358 [Cudoniella acicularis]|uniref:Uncharacterized protein n=1 Tax=Cudoniella acicularis TaxID=354080 RepID=A0A8H4R5A4_9HELO|nr:hypothetical protein G7Y89_g14358 [Cudoniella acicularis]